MPADTDAEYIEEQGEHDLNALIEGDDKAQKISTAVDAKTVAVDHCDNVEKLIYAYQSAVHLFNCKYGPKWG